MVPKLDFTTLLPTAGYTRMMSDRQSPKLTGKMKFRMYFIASFCICLFNFPFHRAYGYKGFSGDANDIFRVEIIKHLSDGPAAKERLRTIQTKFKLIHTMTGCALFSHKVKLPDWGFEQQEVTCARSATLPNSVWYIESNDHPQRK